MVFHEYPQERRILVLRRMDIIFNKFLTETDTVSAALKILAADFNHLRRKNDERTE